MKKVLVILSLCFTLVSIPQKSHAIAWVVIREAIKKAIKAADLEIQRQQNKVIWLQNAQKTLENTLSKLKLDEISDWVGKQKELYRSYYEELAKVKSVISYYQRVKDIATRQVAILNEYKRAWTQFQQDRHFTADEIAYMAQVYEGILKQSADNMEQIYIVVNSFKTTMSDAKRLELVKAAADKVDDNYYDLQRFNRQNAMLSLQRAHDAHDAAVIKQLYGL